MIGRFWTRWRLALRLGSRDALRHRGRSLLVVVLIGLPVLLAAAAGTVIASNSESVEERLPALLGQAPAMAVTSYGSVEQSPDGSSSGSSGSEIPSPAKAEKQLAQLSGARVVEVELGTARALLDGRVRSVEILRTALNDPVTRGMVEVAVGRLPRAASETVVTQSVAERSGGLGSSVMVGGQELSIVGIGTIGTVGRHPTAKSIAVLPDSPIDLRGQVDGDSRFLIDRDTPVSWSEVKKWNRAGFVVTSREVLENPPPASEQYAMSGFSSGFTPVAVAIIVTGMVLEVVLLAGPAFAVSARRQRRALATLAATGGAPADLRRVVLGQAMALSIPAGVGGAILGIGLGALLWRFGPGAGLSMGPFDVPWLPIVATAALGVVAAALAALVPAVKAGRDDTVAALREREPHKTLRNGWPLVGIALMVVGIGGSFTLGTRAGGETTIAVLTVLTVFGAVLLTPRLISCAASAARFLPFPMRIALRDADRHRGRTAPAIAAIMVSIAAVTAFGIASSSDAAQDAQNRTYEAPVGTVRLSAASDAMPAVIAAAEQVSGARFTPMSVLGTGYSQDGSTPVMVFRPDPGYPGSATGVPVVVGDPDVLQAWGVRLTPADLAALDAGKALVADAAMLEAGAALIDIGSPESDDARQEKLPAVAADLSMGPAPTGARPEIAGAVVSPRTAAELKLPITSAVAIADVKADEIGDISALRAAVLYADPADGDVMITRVQQAELKGVVLVLGLLGLIAIAIGTFSASALALNDARADLRTLAAVGAKPRTRRLVTGSMAYVLALLGALIGVVVGFAPGVAATWPLTTMGNIDQGSPVIEVPWLMLVTLVVVVPLVVALVVAAVTRSRLPVVGRQTA